ncbi:leucine-rich repeat isoform f [Anaeramoeba flamelloides]|uniref:Leucine-rich repeat isoform f n=1 Tax=Anaeramoeba flamelloides TaxID=1746091 RepID=A0AAV8A7L5_9EUKA|nr:leucine-rich repeat isoform f [Anaeramoeba flamelloides]
MSTVFENAQQSQVLRELILDDCRIGDSGLILLCEAIYKYSTLEVLSISRNFSKNTTSTCREKISLLFSHPTLKYLRIRGTPKRNLGITFDTSDNFFGPLKANNKLIGLDLSYNFMGENCFITLVDMLSNTNSIISLYFDQNNLTKTAIKKLQQSFERNHKICDIKWPGSDVAQLIKNAKKKERNEILNEIEELQELIVYAISKNRNNNKIIPIKIIDDEIELEIKRKGLNLTAFNKKSGKTFNKMKSGSININSSQKNNIETGETITSEELTEEKINEDEENYISSEDSNDNDGEEDENQNNKLINKHSQLKRNRTRRLTASIEFNEMALPSRVKNSKKDRFNEKNLEENLPENSEEFSD